MTPTCVSDYEFDLEVARLHREIDEMATEGKAKFSAYRKKILAHK